MSMETVTKDRSDYRSMDTRELLEEAMRGVRVDWHELAVVLTERLYDAERETAWRKHCDNCGHRL